MRKRLKRLFAPHENTGNIDSLLQDNVIGLIDKLISSTPPE